MADAGHRVTAIDRDAEAIEYARAHYAHIRIQFRQGDASTVDLAEADAAVCFETIEHIEDPRPLLAALRVAPRLFVSVPNEAAFPWAQHAFHFRHYTKAELARLLESCGWRATRWWGQEGKDSEVEVGVMGRTLVAEAERIEDFSHMVADAPAPVPVAPNHVAILGLGPSVYQYLNLTRRLGGRGVLADEVWGINALGDVFQCDRVFHMDDVRIQEIRASARPDSNIAAMLEWLRRHPGPVYTSRTHPDYPGLVEFPLEDVLNHLGYGYFNSTAAYAVAFAIHIGVKKISCFGMDFTYPNATDSEKGRGCVEFWLGQAAARGIEIGIPRTSSLMDAVVADSEKLYGYDTLDVHIAQESSGKVRVLFEERDSLPTADEIEARYDHSVHPNPLVTE